MMRQKLRELTESANPPRFREIVYRAAAAGEDDLDRAAARTMGDPGRFNTSRFGAVYLSLEPETALKELKRNSEGKLDSCLLYAVEIDLARVVDLCDSKQREIRALSLADLKGDDVHRCQKLAEVLHAVGVEAVIWPSAAGNGRSMAIYPDTLRQESRMEIMGSRPVTEEMVRG